MSSGTRSREPTAPQALCAGRRGATAAEPPSDNLDLHVQSVVSSRLDDPESWVGPAAVPALRPPPVSGGRRSGRTRLTPVARALSRPPATDDVVYATHLPFDPGSSEPSCATAIPPSTWRGSGARRSCVSENSQDKAKDYSILALSASRRRGTFLSQMGPQSWLELVQAEHHLLVWLILSRNDEGDPWVALALSRSAPWFLARAPSSEGRCPPGPAAVGDCPVPARERRHGRGRFGVE